MLCFQIMQLDSQHNTIKPYKQGPHLWAFLVIQLPFRPYLFSRNLATGDRKQKSRLRKKTEKQGFEYIC